MKPEVIREKDDAELRALAASLRDELFRARMQHFTGQLDQPSKLSEFRKTIARVETILHERQIQR